MGDGSWCPLRTIHGEKRREYNRARPDRRRLGGSVRSSWVHRTSSCGQRRTWTGRESPRVPGEVSHWSVDQSRVAHSGMVTIEYNPHRKRHHREEPPEAPDLSLAAFSLPRLQSRRCAPVPDRPSLVRGRVRVWCQVPPVRQTRAMSLCRWTHGTASGPRALSLPKRAMRPRRGAVTRSGGCGDAFPPRVDNVHHCVYGNVYRRSPRVTREAPESRTRITWRSGAGGQERVAEERRCRARSRKEAWGGATGVAEDGAAIRSVDVANMLGTTPRTVSRWNQGHANPRPSKEILLADLEYIVERLAEFYSDPRTARAWLYSRHRYFDGVRPADLVREGRAQEVLEAIDAMADPGHT